MLQRKTFLQSIFSLWCHLRRRRKAQFVVLLLLMMLSSMAEMVSIGAVVPFLGALISPEQVFNHHCATDSAFSGVSRPQDVLLPLTFIFCLAAVAAGLLRLALLFATTQFCFLVGADLSIEVYRRTLYQNYSVHIGRNSSEIINGITGKVEMLIGSVLMPMLTLIGSGILLTGVIWMLLLIDPAIAIIAGLVFGILYLLTALVSRRYLRENSECIAKSRPV